ncbi:MAG TPA: hypothetical protein VKO61_00405 [Candidatus Paceibacterota bacterium]|nr:hypothetical protein [Candidatus Paceibacterota bacterium]
MKFLKDLFKKIKKSFKKIEKKDFSFLKMVFSVLVALILFGLLVLAVVWGVRLIRGELKSFIRDKLVSEIVIEREYEEGPKVEHVPEEEEEEEVEEEEEEIEEEESSPGGSVRERDWIGSSFTDLFSGRGWLDMSKTNMNRDSVTTAFTFPPQFSWRKAGALGVSSSQKFKSGTAQGEGFISCIDNRCLVKDGFSLYVVPKSDRGGYKDPAYKVSLPDDIREGNLVSLSVGALETEWLVGAVEQREGEYYGNVYRVYPTVGTAGSEARFSNIYQGHNLFVSKYKGTIGFGGVDDNFLVVYGGYEGQAYEVTDGSFRSISQFFGIRVMEKRGFYPQVIRKRGNGGSGFVWYVWSRTEGVPKLLKLFENGTGHIVGSIDLSKSLFGSDAKKVTFYSVDGGMVLNSEVLTYGGDREFWIFEDQGFKKSGEGVIHSSNINTYPAKVKKAMISRVDAGNGGGEVSYYLSNDLEKWREVGVDDWAVFSDRDQRRLFWKIEVSPSDNQWVSPFIDTLQVGYYVEFL